VLLQHLTPIPGITHWQHPKFMAYFPAISTYESMLGELYSSSVSNPGFNVSGGYLPETSC
jgi:aromatic-L-amino-acid decarboxylase